MTDASAPSGETTSPKESGVEKETASEAAPVNAEEKKPQIPPESKEALGEDGGKKKSVEPDGNQSAPESDSSSDEDPPASQALSDMIGIIQRNLLKTRNELVKLAPRPALPGKVGVEPTPEDKFFGEIIRLPMSEWAKRKHLKTVSVPRNVVLRAYYRKLPSSTTQKSTDSYSPKDLEEPQRIAISSTWLISELESITSIATTSEPVFTKPPYKAFVQFWPGIKERLVTLKDELLQLEAEKEDTEPSEGKLTETIPNEPSAKGHAEGVPKPAVNRIFSRAQKLIDLRFRVSHLEALHDFISAELSRPLALRAKIEDGSIERIGFADIWQLFNAGDLLYSKDHGFEQLYRAYAVTGGQQRMRNLTRREMEDLRRNFSGIHNHRYYARLRYQNESEISEQGAFSEEDQDLNPRGTAIGVGTWTPFTIDCYNIVMDSTQLGAVECCKRIQWYIGEKNIRDLPIIPLRFLPEQDVILQRLEARGLKCVQCVGHQKYDGSAYDSKGRSRRERLQGDIYVDYEEYYRKRNFFEPRLGTLRRTTPEPTEIEEEEGRDNFSVFSLDHEIDRRKSDIFLASHAEEQQPKSREAIAQNKMELRLMCHQIIAFVFRSRKWARLEVNFVEDIDKSFEARNSGFHDLIIKPKYRRLLVSLVDSHTSNANKWGKVGAAETKPLNQLDLVRGKGLGLTVLLHGPPGTGKTSTAETIASYTGKPLYSITCGDLGDSPAEIERKLEKHTGRADKWECVLLLDEADVFLMRRDFKDTQRNALVSIFLRILEYYSGILFLTTNRVGVLDEAFKSRVHIALRYPKVRLPETLDIWKGCLDRIEKDNEFRDIKIQFDRGELMEFAERHYQKHHKKDSTWNGRQIRNAFQTAIALGQYERNSKIQKKGLTEAKVLASGKEKWRIIQLTKKNLEVIAETAQDFEKYMEAVHRYPDVEIAKADQIRDDDFSELSEEEPPLRKSHTFKHSSGRKESSKKSGKSVATSSARAATRADDSTAEDNPSSSDGDIAANESSSDDTDDDI
ncbi:uncharacterized protein F4822DRAFT_15137 [Hypoxylon trugodes]|uniref:uncharacterized protein n=1 Tax=Hypoxylon trugodes TaxID=326681 RepID=UPI0021936C9C|nr:uncharacterized protein F4822DRAFT_15137 [Hypoxylon trugodes]KAI1393500.1 hypothetical protein F4822DRAFT_15137 [Hypoxylon trugodes]